MASNLDIYGYEQRIARELAALQDPRIQELIIQKIAQQINDEEHPKPLSNSTGRGAGCAYLYGSNELFRG